MGEQIKSLRTIVINKVNDWRAVDRIVSSLDFEKLFEGTQTKEIVIKWVSDGNILALKTWFAGEKRKYLDQLSYAALRLLAAKCKITNYSRLSKGELLTMLKTIQEGKHA